MQWCSHNNTIDVEGRFEVFMLDDKVTPSGGIVDAFGRLRISDAFTVYDRGTYTLAIAPGSQQAKVAGHIKWLRVV